MTLRENSVILIDSDLEPDVPRAKKARLPPRAPMALFTKPFMQASDSSGEESTNNGTIAKTGTKLHSPPIGDSSELSASGDFSDLEEFLNPEEEEQKVALKRTVTETRKFLQERGVMGFLQEYLPATATSEDIVLLIVNLGFAPKNVPPLADGENLLQLIKLLHMAMKKVSLLRPRLEFFNSVDHVLNALKSCNNILIITGAGISTSLGIPDFRSSKGFYSQLSSLGLTDPQEVFDLEIFHTDPSIFYSIAHMILPPDHVYAPLHKFIKLLQDKGKLLRNYSQNIDNLEANAGIWREKLVQCHGSFGFATCVTCGYEVEGEKIFPALRNKEIAYCPKCDGKRKKLLKSEDVYVQESYGVMKPNITFFGEALPKRFHLVINQDLRDCDLIISIGTSLKVAPVSLIVEKVSPSVPQILINRDPIHHCNFDVSLLGYCDDAVSYLCDKLSEDWGIDHPDYALLVGKNNDNLELIPAPEVGVYNVKNKERELKAAAEKAEAMPQPDFVILEPTIE